MAEHEAGALSTLALSTKLEEDFVSPLTAVRGALEILRDFPDLTLAERRRFVETALSECARLERGVAQLGSTVYAAGERANQRDETELPEEAQGPYVSRLQILDEHEAIEVDFSNFEFSSSKLVNEFYDTVERFVQATGRSWYFIVNYNNTSIWPEAWVAFAHRGKKINVNYSLGTVRYVDGEADGNATDTFESRERALAHIDEIRRKAKRGGKT